MMRVIGIILCLTWANLLAEKNAPIDKLDFQKYAGKWYSLYSIPTVFDKGSRETTTTYTLNKEGYYTVITTYKKPNDQRTYSRESKMFPPETGHKGNLKAQFIWPIQISYWIIELAPDYSYVVVGHPEHKFLFIMSRSKSIPKEKYDEIIARCKLKGYAVAKLTSQKH